MHLETFSRYLALVRSFPVMQHAPSRALSSGGIDLQALDAWGAASGSPSTRLTVSFVLNVWSSSEPWLCGRFDLFEALIAWDEGQRRAFGQWAADPWRP